MHLADVLNHIDFLHFISSLEVKPMTFGIVAFWATEMWKPRNPTVHIIYKMHIKWTIFGLMNLLLVNNNAKYLVWLKKKYISGLEMKVYSSLIDGAMGVQYMRIK